MSSVVWFDELSKQDVALAGGKGANLGELTRAGVPVPPGFVVTAPAYRDYLERAGLGAYIAETLAGLDVSDRAALQEASHMVQRRFEAAPVPDELAAAVRHAYERLGGGPVAVRSSATAEDLPEASFAGQQSTFLNVGGPERVIEAVRACWASLFEPQAVFYRANRGYSHTDVAIAVPVQAMVQSERSGVMFTVNPVTGDRDQIVIEAVWGLGEAAVSGQVTPDMYVVDKASCAVLERNVAEQDQEIVRSVETDQLHATAWRDVQPHLRTEGKLSDEQAAALARLGLGIEEHYGAAQDIEWAMAGQDTFILQARPVTTI